MEHNHYFYVVQCSDGSYYAGYTNRLKQRILHHNEGKGAKYTRARRPVTLIYYEIFASKSDAMKAEYHFKQLRRSQKEVYMKRGDCHVATKKLSAQ